MKYYLIDITFLSDETNPIGIFAYEGYNVACSAFYSTVSSKYANENVEKAVIKLVDWNGNDVLNQIVINESNPENSEE